MGSYNKYGWMMALLLGAFAFLYAYNFSFGPAPLSDYLRFLEPVSDDVVDWDYRNPSLFYGLMSILFLYYFGKVTGLFEGSFKGGASYGGEFQAINRLYEYRNSRLNGMNNADGADIMKSSALLDAAMRVSGSSEDDIPQEALRTMRYINGRLNGMNNEDGLKWLMGQK
jgi:hypothetical protein